MACHIRATTRLIGEMKSWLIFFAVSCENSKGSSVPKDLVGVALVNIGVFVAYRCLVTPSTFGYYVHCEILTNTKWQF